MNIFAFRWFVLFMIVSLFGCATAWKVAENPAFQTTVQYAVIKFLSNDESKQSQAQVIIQKLQQYTDQSAQVTVDDLKQQVTDQVSWKRLDAADQYLLRKMIDDIAEYAQEQVGEGVLSGDDKVRLQEFLDWIEQAINFSGDQYTRINFNITQM
ncbi:MAG: hypothetical protein ACOCQD_03035 [archaeon]